jgi:hypothetical protein
VAGAIAIALDGIMFRDRSLTFRFSESSNDACVKISWRVPSAMIIAAYTLDSSIWHPSFASSSATGKNFFDRIFTERNVYYVRNDFKAKALKIYSELGAKEKACQMIREEVNCLAQNDAYSRSCIRRLFHAPRAFSIKNAF